MKDDFVDLLRDVLVSEKGHTVEDANRLIEAYPYIVKTGIMHGNSLLRTTAIALEIRDEERTEAK